MRELIAPRRQLLPRPDDGRGSAGGAPAPPRLPTAFTANSPAARSARYSSRWRSAAARACCSWTSPPSDSTSRRAKRCGPASARCSPMAARSCSRLTTWKKPKRSPTRVAVLAKGRVIASRQRRRHALARGTAADQLRIHAHARNRARLARRRRRQPRPQPPADHRHRRRRRRAAPAGRPTRICAVSTCAKPDLPKHSTNSPARPHEHPER